MSPFTSFQDPCASGPLQDAQMDETITSAEPGMGDETSATQASSAVYCAFQDPDVFGPDIANDAPAFHSIEEPITAHEDPASYVDTQDPDVIHPLRKAL